MRSSCSLVGVLCLLISAGCQGGRKDDKGSPPPQNNPDGASAAPAPGPGADTPEKVNPAQEKAVAEVEKLGGKVSRNYTPGNPVYAVSFQYAKADVKQLAPLLKDFDQLKELNLSDAEITDPDLAHLKGLTALKQLHLGSNKITDEGLVHLKGLTALESLRVGDNQITDAGLVHLKELKNLKTLGLGSLGGKNKITDAGLVHLKDLTNLEYLNLHSCSGVTDAGMAHLTGLTKLKELWLPFTKVTDKGIADIKKSLPNVKIEK